MKVLPKRSVLDGNGHVWEYELAQRGWNELPDEQKPGVVTRSSDRFILMIVRFPALNNFEVGVFKDEVEEVRDN